jgi:hypothetical protein
MSASITEKFEEVAASSPERFAEIKRELLAQSEKFQREHAVMTRDLQNILVTNLRKTNSLLIAVQNGQKLDSKAVELQIASNHGVIGKLHS